MNAPAAKSLTPSSKLVWHAYPNGLGGDILRKKDGTGRVFRSEAAALRAAVAGAMTAALAWRTVSRTEPGTGREAGISFAFYECGHMHRFAVGLGPVVGQTRRCYTCEHNAKTAKPIT